MKRVVLVLGCHRSGTSLAAAALPCFGVALGDRLLGAAPDNPRGFHEDVDFMRINEGVLARNFGSWSQPPKSILNIAPGDVQRAEQLLHQRLGRWPLYGLKDPRFCVTLPFWRPIFARTGVEVSVVVALRHPWSVAASLKKRNAMPIGMATQLWLTYMSTAIADMDPSWKRVVVDYDLLVEKPITELQRVEAALGLALNPVAANIFIRDFVDEGLRHAAFWNEADEMPDGLAACYDRLYRAARGSFDDAAFEAIRALHRGLAGVTP